MLAHLIGARPDLGSANVVAVVAAKQDSLSAGDGHENMLRELLAVTRHHRQG
jgi:hypothetical protein